MSQNVYVAGVGMIPFTKPGACEPYPQMAAQAVRLALRDAGLDYRQVQQCYAGYVFGESTCGQRAVYEVGMTGIPVINVNNNCSTGSTALFLARQAVESGVADCVLALGFEQMNPGALAATFTFGREDLLPDLFLRIVDALHDQAGGGLDDFRYYLRRHIGLDGDEHGPLASRLVQSLCGDDEGRWEVASRAAAASLEARRDLWDGVCASLKAAHG